MLRTVRGCGPFAGSCGSEGRLRAHAHSVLRPLTGAAPVRVQSGCASAHAVVIKSIVVQALRAPLEAVWDVDVLPGSCTQLHSIPGGWRLTRLSCSLP